MQILLAFKVAVVQTDVGQRQSRVRTSRRARASRYAPTNVKQRRYPARGPAAARSQADRGTAEAKTQQAPAALRLCMGQTLPCRYSRSAAPQAPGVLLLHFLPSQLLAVPHTTTVLAVRLWRPEPPLLRRAAQAARSARLSMRSSDGSVKAGANGWLQHQQAALPSRFADASPLHADSGRAKQATQTGMSRDVSAYAVPRSTSETTSHETSSCSDCGPASFVPSATEIRDESDAPTVRNPHPSHQCRGAPGTHHGRHWSRYHQLASSSQSSSAGLCPNLPRRVLAARRTLPPLSSLLTLISSFHSRSE